MQSRCRRLLTGAKEVTRRPTRMVKACLTVIKVGKAGRDEFSSVLVVGKLLSPLTVSPFRNDSRGRNDAILLFSPRVEFSPRRATRLRQPGKKDVRSRGIIEARATRQSLARRRFCIMHRDLVIAGGITASNECSSLNDEAVPEGAETPRNRTLDERGGVVVALTALLRNDLPTRPRFDLNFACSDGRPLSSREPRIYTTVAYYDVAIFFAA